MDAIDVNKNYTTTECGHCFHANCLMKSVAHNGFGCPYCRTTMAEVPDDDDDTSNEENDDDIYNNDVLRGLRFFANNLQGIGHDEDDIDAEDDYQTELLEESTDEEDESIPTTQFVSHNLREQGINYDQLVSLILFNNHEEYETDALERLDGEVFGKIRRIVTNYARQQSRQVGFRMRRRNIPAVRMIVIDESEISPSNITTALEDSNRRRGLLRIKANINLTINLKFQELLLGKILFVFILYAFGVVLLIKI
jgi:hypothetical protein